MEAGPGGLGAFAAGDARIGIESDHPLGSQRLIGGASAAPVIADARHLGAAIDGHPDGVFLLGIEIGRQNPGGFHLAAILQSDGELLGFAPAVLLQSVDRVGVEGAQE